MLKHWKALKKEEQGDDLLHYGWLHGENGLELGCEQRQWKMMKVWTEMVGVEISGRIWEIINRLDRT